MASRFCNWLVLGAFVLSAGGSAQDQVAGTTGRAQTAAERATERLNALRRESETLAAQESRLLVELRKLEVERQIKAEELAQVEGRLKDTQRKLADSTARATQLRRTAEAARPDVEARLVHLYKLGRAGYWRLLLDVEDLRSLGRAYRTAAALTQIDRDRVQAHQRTLEALDRERESLGARAKELGALQEQARRARVAADRAVAAHSALVASIDERRDLNAQMTGELQAAQQQLQASVTRLPSDTPGAAALPLRPFQGALPWPARGRLASRFGRQASSQYGTAIVRNGMEIALAEGQPVRAVHEGVVAFSGQFTGYGNLVILEHGGRAFSLYGHLSSLHVARGERVDAGAQLGLSGRNPSGNPALYFELRVDGKPVDPLQWLQKGIL
jgi:septal ring factor EnvC (AmiA/AmiB activator)